MAYREAIEELGSSGFCKLTTVTPPMERGLRFPVHQQPVADQ